MGTLLTEITLEMEQKIQMDILNHFDYICRSEGIKYFLFAGTLLGAVREKGFIKWDDDVDLCMTENEAQKLIIAWPHYCNEKYFLQTHETDKYYFTPGVIRICVNGTFKWPSSYLEAKFNTGIYMDIFLLFDADVDKRKDVKRKLYCKYLSKLYYYRFRKISECSGIKQRIVTILSKTVPVSLIKLVYKQNVTNNFKASDRKIMYLSGGDIDTYTFDNHFFEKQIYLPFNGRDFPCPNDYHTMLSQHYGKNYMTPMMTKPMLHKAYQIESMTS